MVEGDIAAFNELSATRWHEVEEAKGDPLILSRNAVVRVLNGLRQREIRGEEAKRWVSFVRRGYLSNEAAGQTLTPLVEAMAVCAERRAARTIVDIGSV